MKQLVVLSATFAVARIFAAGIFVGANEEKTLDVVDDSVQSDTMVVTTHGKLVKEGEGTLTLETGALAQDWEASLGVKEGTLKLKGTVASERSFPGVEAILAKAALHLDASDAESLVCSGDAVHEWLDTRETGVAGSYIYSRAVTNTTAALIPELDLEAADLLPVKAETANKTGVYFNGYKSGTWMNLVKNDGTQESLKLFNVFVVQAVVSANGLGTILGVNIANAGSSNLGFVPRNASGVPVPLWQRPAGAAAGALTSSRTYLDGAQIDAYNAGLPVGKIAVFDVEMLAAGALWENIFNDRGYIGLPSASIPSEAAPYFRTGAGELRAGGEYVFEIVAFTSSLSPSERTELAAYLRQKWLGTPQVSEVSVDTASGATVLLDDPGNVNVSLSGDGTFGVTAGSVGRSAAIPYRLSSGEELTVAGGQTEESLRNAAIGLPVYSSEPTAGDGQAVVKGGADLRVNEISSDIESLSVEAGELKLEAPRKASSTVEAVVAGGNGSFEEGKDEYGQDKDFQNGGGFKGWHHVTASGLSGSVFLYNQAKSGGRNNSTWAIPNTSPAGDVVLGIKQDASVWTTVVIPEKGRYILSFLGSCRQGASGQGYSCDIAVGGLEEDELTTVGVFTVPRFDGRYHRYEFMLPELEAGEYQLWFKSRESGLDRCAVIDDVRAVLADDEDLCWVPNGNFENCFADKLPTLDDKTFWFYKINGETYHGREALQDWVLTQNDEYSDAAYRGAAPVFGTTVTGWGGAETIGRFAELDGGDDGLVQLFISYGCTASVTFTPPAGTYRLVASAAVRLGENSASEDMSLAASVTPEGGGKVDLGAVNLKNVYRLRQCVLPETFTADGETPITLTLAPLLNSGSKGHLVIDNVRLIKAEKMNIVVNGDFEKNGDVWSGTFHHYGDNAAAWGSCRASGTYCGKLQKAATLAQKITVPSAGLYRLRVMARTRQTMSSSAIDGAGRNPVAVELVSEDDVTKRVALFTPVYTNFTEFTWCVNVTEAGQYTLRFAGQSADRDRTSFIDDVSFVKEDAAAAPTLHGNLRLTVAEGAKLRLDYTGIGEVDRIKLGGIAVSGYVSAETHPQFISGDGVLYARPKPTVMIIR